MVVLLLMPAAAAAALPDQFPVGTVDLRTADVSVALGAVRVLGHAVPTAADVAALAEHLGAVGIGVFQEVMIEDLAEFLARADLAASLAVAVRRRPAHQPVADVQVVDVLFADMVAAQPIKVVPVAHLVLQFALILLPRAHPDAAAVPVDARTNDVADRPVAQAGDRFLVLGFMVALQADGHHQALLLRFFVRGQQAPDSRRVRTQRLLHEYVLSGLDRGFEVQRPESGRRGQNHQIDVALQNSLVGVETRELPLRRHVQLIPYLALDRSVCALQPVSEHVAHCHQFDRPVRVQILFGR